MAEENHSTSLTVKKRLFTGIKPTAASLHLGNYFGALKPFLDIYTEHDSFLALVDYHALTTVHNG